MTKPLLTFAFLLSSIISCAQKIHFTDTTNQWNGYVHECPYHNPDTPAYHPRAYTAIYSGDTIITGILYRKLIYNDTIPSICYIREDTIARKIFAKQPNDTTEYLLYDYTLNIGDTFKIPVFAPVPSVFYVDYKDSVIINSIWHKIWHFEYYSGVSAIDTSFVVIEGIGCLTYPLYPIWALNAELCINLTCFHNDGTIPLVSPEVAGYFDNATSCSLTYPLNVSNTSTIHRLAKIIPNPIDETSKIVLPYNISSGTLTVLNDIGQIVINTTFQNKEEVLIGDKIHSPGIYYYRVTDNGNGKVFSGKFVSQ